jgi:DNA repair protein RadC
MRKMRDVPLQDRPREKIENKGASALSDTELIEAIIGRGTRHRDVREIAKDVCGILKDRHDIRYEDIRAIEGIGPTRASQIMACFEMGR